MQSPRAQQYLRRGISGASEGRCRRVLQPEKPERQPWLDEAMISFDGRQQGREARARAYAHQGPLKIGTTVAHRHGTFSRVPEHNPDAGREPGSKRLFSARANSGAGCYPRFNTYMYCTAECGAKIYYFFTRRRSLCIRALCQSLKKGASHVESPGPETRMTKNS